jgi:peptidoglycan/LPS O-acetylase OafA/YrhL
MLEISMIVLLLGSIYAVAIAPPDQRVLIGVVLVALTAIGYAAAFALTKAGTDQRTYYPIAGAIGGAMIAFSWISHKRKSWPKKKP